MLRTILQTGAIAATMLAAPAARPQAADDPLTRPIEAERAARWLTPQAPIRLYGNSNLVGFGGLNVGLIKTSAGLIVIDAALPQAVGRIEDNIRALGFRVGDVKLILSTEPHYDHAGGIAALARDSGATVVARAPAAAALRVGRNAPDDPQVEYQIQAPPVARVRIVRDGERIRLGDTVVTAHATPGHTAGSTSWTWPSCARGRCLTMVFASSLSPISGDAYRFSDTAHAPVIANFRRSYGVLRALRCDILISAHPEQSGGDVKYAAFRTAPLPNPYIDPAACRTFAGKYERMLDDRLAKERATPAP